MTLGVTWVRRAAQPLPAWVAVGVVAEVAGKCCGDFEEGLPVGELIDSRQTSAENATASGLATEQSHDNRSVARGDYYADSSRARRRWTPSAAS